MEEANLYGIFNDLYTTQQLQHLNNELLLLTHERYIVYNKYNNLIYNIALIHQKIETYKNVLNLKKIVAFLH